MATEIITITTQNTIDITGMTGDELDHLLYAACQGGADAAERHMVAAELSQVADAAHGKVEEIESQIAALDSRCKKCNGQGRLNQYYYVRGGVCFRCEGSRVDPSHAPKAHDLRCEKKRWEDFRQAAHNQASSVRADVSQGNPFDFLFWRAEEA